MALAFSDPATEAGHLGVAIGDIATIFNGEARRHGAPERLILDEGTCERGQRTVCTYAVSQSVGVLTSTERDSTNISEFAVMFVGHDRDGFQDAVAAYVLAMAVFDPELTDDERADIVRRLFDGVAGRDDFAIDGKAVRVLTEHAGKLADIEPHFDANSNIYEGEARTFLAACRGEAPPAATATSSSRGRVVEAPARKTDRGRA